MCPIRYVCSTSTCTGTSFAGVLLSGAMFRQIANTMPTELIYTPESDGHVTRAIENSNALLWRANFTVLEPNLEVMKLTASKRLTRSGPSIEKLYLFRPVGPFFPPQILSTGSNLTSTYHLPLGYFQRRKATDQFELESHKQSASMFVSGFVF